MTMSGNPMWTACIAAVTACIFLMAQAPKRRPGRLVRRTKPDDASGQDACAKVDRLLFQLAFKSLTDYDPIRYFQVDVLRIEFLDGMMPPDVQYAFFTYAQELDLSSSRAIMKLCMWLEQHGVKYALKFSWCRSMPVCYNLRRIRMARDIRQALARCGHEKIMAYNLESCPYARKKNDRKGAAR